MGFKESCEMQWLLNVFLKEHMPTGGMPKVDKLKVKKGTGCLGEGFWQGPAADSAFQSMSCWFNPIRIGSFLTFNAAFMLGGLDTLRYCIFWRTVLKHGNEHALKERDCAQRGTHMMTVRCH